MFIIRQILTNPHQSRTHTDAHADSVLDSFTTGHTADTFSNNFPVKHNSWSPQNFNVLTIITQTGQDADQFRATFTRLHFDIQINLDTDR